MVISAEALNQILKHGAYYAAKWAGHEDERDMWAHRYFTVQKVYADITESITAYEDFNKHCGVTVENGRIACADGTKCDIELEIWQII